MPPADSYPGRLHTIAGAGCNGEWLGGESGVFRLTLHMYLGVAFPRANKWDELSERLAASSEDRRSCFQASRGHSEGGYRFVFGYLGLYVYKSIFWS